MKEETILKNKWTKHFRLTAKSTLKYYKIVGCFIIGFEFPQKFGELQPHFVIYPLWKKNLKECFSWPYLLLHIKDSKGFDYKITLSDILENISEIITNTEKYLGVSLLDDIHSEDIIKLSLETWNKNNSYDRIAIVYIKSYMSTYLNDIVMFNQTIFSLDNLYAQMNSDWFKRNIGEYDKWKENLVSVFSNRQAVLDKIEENIANSKIKERVELLP